ncbi:MAG: glycosyltransferase [Thermodesulfobacteriota bacterium]|nr:glycosyltransferase [Thermodesulfobacteriota bacterium]
MKILHVLETSIPNLVGYTIRAKYIVENQKKSGMEPVVVTSPFFQNGDPQIRKEIHNGTIYYRTNFIKRPDKEHNKIVSYLTRLSMIHNYKRAVLKIAKLEKPNVIHAHSSYTNCIAANYASKKTKIPSIYEMRSLWGESAVVDEGLIQGSMKYKMIWNLEMNVARNAKKVIPISKGIKDEIISRGIDPEKISIIPNGVDTGTFRPNEKDDSLMKKYDLKNGYVVGYIGSIRKLEGLSCLIEAFKKVTSELPLTKLLIVGEGPELENLKDFAKKYNSTKNIVFTGLVPHEKILRYYSVIDIFVFPRIDAKINQTVTPLKPLEAMSAGKVCIGSNVGGLKELIKDNYNGLLFKSEDSNDLAEKTIQLIKQKPLYNTLKQNGMDWVRKKRDWDVLIPRYQVIYNELQEVVGDIQNVK